MIGQKRLLSELNSMINSDTLPRFIIIVGERGSQSDEIAPFIADVMASNYVKLPDVKVATVRNMIDEAYDFKDTVVFNIVDADNMSASAKNAMLKVCEEPPNNAYFVMTLEDISNTLQTIKSRATVFTMDKYSKQELMQYYKSKYKDNGDLICRIADTPGDIDILSDNVQEFYDYVEEVVSDLHTVDGSVAFNMLDKVSTKDSDGKYDTYMFFKLFSYICLDLAVKQTDSKIISKYCWSAIYASKSIQSMLRIRGINRQMLLDDFVLKVRKAWK